MVLANKINIIKDESLLSEISGGASSRSGAGTTAGSGGIESILKTIVTDVEKEAVTVVKEISTALNLGNLANDMKKFTL